MSVSTLKYCSAPLNWTSTWNLSVGSLWLSSIVLILHENLSKLSQFSSWKFWIWTWQCFVLFFVGYPGDCVHSVCSAGFFFQVHFWTAISCAERGSQNCPKLIGGLMGFYGTKPTGKSLRQPWNVSAPESRTCSSSFPVPSAPQYLQTPTNTDILTVTLTV